ncbi:SsrA-binding protein [Candidatus Azambacteria bacterium RIFOXYD1_FULL_42_11]|uniref:SsrA-binding protein n=4 Tax=Candidatus Azamiibacteriota TaxID=1752741 RepID=A0A0G1C9E5_9BACT|nr:MAG: SsrA-binding protein [Candidatus Azambacteria bacterium GW2011_GWB1_42_17]KKS46238.1 MAG: SsrA-binding protein [Candidatus Azambacteria bacterium GW2011_GWA1_42_19]KKS75581.1 MAG: SsrA-binding protein [Candidatus Azambacteria bacterium GW2011_GWA2_42_9]KKS88812.1 MAG: SsrA-binding protein [Parcubacteria group bacterium GW2011_GWC1_43_11]OGD43257.1 MAG: SsrA-binding protein [Candidatus Azambacteria bacterium RIFOXYD1_FULL_42_11]
MATFAENRKVYFDYEILEKFEAGLVLSGAEVKSIRSGRMNLAGSYVRFIGGGLQLVGAAVAPYQPKNQPPDYDQSRSRKLLVKKSEIRYLTGKIQERGLTLVPLRVYNKGRRIKIEIGLARGKKQYDKRASIAQKETQRKIERAIKKEM